MAKAANNLLLRGVSGKLGGMIVRQMRDGSIRLCATPDFSNRQLSDAQKDHHKAGVNRDRVAPFIGSVDGNRVSTIRSSPDTVSLPSLGAWIETTETLRQERGKVASLRTLHSPPLHFGDCRP